MNPLWKEYFYFSKRDKIASFALILLILIIGSIHYFSDSIFSRENNPYNEEILAEFERFQQGLTEVDMGDEPDETQKNVLSPTGVNSEKGESIDINSVTLTDLKKLSGIGDTYASRIIEYREKLGGFVQAEQLMEVEGITQNRYDKIAPYLDIRRKHALIYINRFGEEELLQHPYLNKKQVEVICRTRMEKKIESLEELLHAGSFSPRDLDKLGKYLAFD